LLANPATPVVLLIVGLILIQRSMQKTLMQSIEEVRVSDLRDIDGNRVIPQVRAPKLRPTLLVIVAAVVFAFVLLLLRIVTYNPQVASLTPKVMMPVEKTRPWTPPAPLHASGPTIKIGSQGPCSINQAGGTANQATANCGTPLEIKWATHDVAPPALSEGKHRGGYPLDSPSPYRLWFAFRLPEVRVNYPVMGNRIDGHSLLRQAKEELAATLGSPTVEPEREFIEIVV